MLRRVITHPATWIALGAFALYAFYALCRWPQFLPAGYDLGIFDQVVRSYAHFQAPIVSLKGDDFNIFGDHFHPILALLAPLYWVWDDPRILLIAQAALVAASTVWVYRFADRRMVTLGVPRRALAIVITLIYALGWPIQAMIDFDFHEIAFAIPLLAWAMDAYDRHSDRELLIAAGILLLVREDMGAIVFMLGLLRVFRKPRWPGVAMMLVGLLVFALVVGVVIPAFAANGYAYWNYSVLGASAGDAVHTLLTRPGDVLVALVTPTTKLVTLIALLAPLLALPLLSPLSLIALPILVQRFLADREALWGVTYHYNAPVWIIFTLAAIDGLARLLGWLPRADTATGRRTLAIVLIGIMAVVPVAGTVIRATNTEGLFPFGRMLSAQAWKQTPHILSQAASIGDIPPGTCVAVDDRLAPRLLRTNHVTVPGVSAHEPDYYVIDSYYERPATTPANWTTTETLDHALSLGYTVIAVHGTVLVLRSPAYAGPTARCGS